VGTHDDKQEAPIEVEKAIEAEHVAVRVLDHEIPRYSSHLSASVCKTMFTLKGLPPTAVCGP
jgi:hypothetical protein